MIRLLTAVLLFASFGVVPLPSVADTPQETDTTGGLPIWLLYQASVKRQACLPAASCVPPGTAITDSNFDAAITDWFSSGNASQYGDITKWCTGAVTNMSYAFRDKTTFNADISCWDTSNVEYTVAMFYGATSFNQPIDSWDTSNVTTMDAMFFDAYRFNADISGWDTSNVTTMSYVFFNAITFNQDIGSWDTSKVGDMRFMFKQAISFNQDLSSWNASFVENCDSFADEATAWLDAYDPDAFFPSIAGKTPPLSPSLIAAGCGD